MLKNTMIFLLADIFSLLAGFGVIGYTVEGVSPILLTMLLALILSVTRVVVGVAFEFVSKRAYQSVFSWTIFVVADICVLILVTDLLYNESGALSIVDAVILRVMYIGIFVLLYLQDLSTTEKITNDTNFVLGAILDEANKLAEEKSKNE